MGRFLGYNRVKCNINVKLKRCIQQKFCKTLIITIGHKDPLTNVRCVKIIEKFIQRTVRADLHPCIFTDEFNSPLIFRDAHTIQR